MNNPAKLQNLGEQTKALRHRLLDAIANATKARKKRDEVVKTFITTLPEQAEVDHAVELVASLAREHDEAVAAYRKEQSVA